MEGCELSQVVKRVSEEKHGFAGYISKIPNLTSRLHFISI